MDFTALRTQVIELLQREQRRNLVNTSVTSVDTSAACASGM